MACRFKFLWILLGAVIGSTGLKAQTPVPITPPTPAQTPVPTQSLSPSSPLQQFDDRILLNLAKHRTPERNKFMVAMSKTLVYGDIGVPAGMMLGGIIGKDPQLRQNAIYVASSTLVTSLLTVAIKTLVKRQRPYKRNIKIIPVYEATYWSFPSGHTSCTMSTATSVSMAYPKWYVIAPAFLWSGTVSYSRIYLGVHYPTDVAAGTILGVGTAASMSFMSRYRPD